MKFLALAPFFSVSMFAVADSNLLSPPTSGMLQGGALAVLAWVVWYMLAKAFPAHNKALKDQREDFLEALRDSLAGLKENNEALRGVRRNTKTD